MKFKNSVISLIALGLLLFTNLVGARSLPKAKVVKICVKGLACPFCAYGLEKRLKETGQGEVKIYVDKGLAQIHYGEKESLNLNQLNEAVKKGGFTPGTVEINTHGKLDKRDEHWFFEVSNSKELFLMKSDETLEKMISEIQKGVTVRISAVVETKTEKGHGEHPAILKILSYEKVQ